MRKSNVVPQACISRILNAKGGEQDFEANLDYSVKLCLKKQNKKQALITEKIRAI